jgi:limonene-1,2-epoxide hydrolase
MSDDAMTRRVALAAGGIGALAALSLSTGLAQAAESGAPETDGEKANLALVKDFIGTWTIKDFDIDKMSQKFLADDSKVRMIETMPFASGPAAAATIFKSYMSSGERIDVKFLSTYAKGPIVVTHRIDTVMIPGKPDQPFHVVGVFFVKDGKIKEWTDYTAS